MAEGAEAAAAASKPSSGWFTSSLKRSQLEILQALVTKHLTDPSLVDISTADDFALTTTERGISRYQHSHLVAALDVLLIYQKDRKANKGIISMSRSYTRDPRTRLVELLKRWLRTHAVDSSLAEDEVKRINGLCRDILNHPKLFPSRNSRSFMRTLAEVFDHLQMQLRDVLEHDRTCAELAARVLTLSRNLVSDAAGYMLLAATDLKQTDELPSLEVVVLWTSLPMELNPLPSRSDKRLQKAMRDAWKTLCGSLVAALVCTPWALRLFDSSAADEARPEGAARSGEPAAKAAKGGSKAAAPRSEEDGPSAQVRRLLAEVSAQFGKGNFKKSGLAGAFREPRAQAARQCYLDVGEGLLDLMYLLGDVLTQFARISDGLGDYGMIRVAPWLHPCLEAVMDKVGRLRSRLDELNQAVDHELVLAKARGEKVKKPLPSERQSSRAHACIARAVTGRESHAAGLLQALEELKGRSAPERLPHVVDNMGDACLQLQDCLGSAQFRLCVGDKAFQEIPPLRDMGAAHRGPLGMLGFGADGHDSEYAGELSGFSASDSDGQDIDEAAAEPDNPFSPTSASPFSAEVEGNPFSAEVEGSPAADATAAAEAPVAELRAEVRKVTRTRAGELAGGDRRTLLLTGGHLEIFAPGSSEKVKTRVDVQLELDSCELEQAGVLSLQVRRRRSGLLRGGGSEPKAYLFEFEPAPRAAAFQAAVARLRENGTW